MLPFGMAGTDATVQDHQTIHLQRLFAILTSATQINTLYYARGRQNNDAQVRTHATFSLGFP